MKIGKLSESALQKVSREPHYQEGVRGIPGRAQQPQGSRAASYLLCKERALIRYKSRPLSRTAFCRAVIAVYRFAVTRAG